jgi:hypothetical protein
MSMLTENYLAECKQVDDCDLDDDKSVETLFGRLEYCATQTRLLQRLAFKHGLVYLQDALRLARAR